MVEETGVVKSIAGMTAIVSVPKKSACEGCTAGICKPDEQSMEIEALNRAGAKVGQKVRVAVKSYAYTKGSMLVYGLPAVSLIIGAVLGKEVFSRFFEGMDPDILSAIFGFGAFMVSFVIIKIWTVTAGKRADSRPVIEEILS
ncbi:MAG: SoxR reducing system RseC family protein [Nitrospirota bacterium]